MPLNKTILSTLITKRLQRIFLLGMISCWLEILKGRKSNLPPLDLRQNFDSYGGQEIREIAHKVTRSAALYKISDEPVFAKLAWTLVYNQATGRNTKDLEAVFAQMLTRHQLASIAPAFGISPIENIAATLGVTFPQPKEAAHNVRCTATPNF